MIGQQTEVSSIESPHQSDPRGIEMETESLRANLTWELTAGKRELTEEEVIMVRVLSSFPLLARDFIYEQRQARWTDNPASYPRNFKPRISYYPNGNTSPHSTAFGENKYHLDFFGRTIFIINQVMESTSNTGAKYVRHDEIVRLYESLTGAHNDKETAALIRQIVIEMPVDRQVLTEKLFHFVLLGISPVSPVPKVIVEQERYLCNLQKLEEAGESNNSRARILAHFSDLTDKYISMQQDPDLEFLEMIMYVFQMLAGREAHASSIDSRHLKQIKSALMSGGDNLRHTLILRTAEEFGMSDSWLVYQRIEQLVAPYEHFEMLKRLEGIDIMEHVSRIVREGDLAGIVSSLDNSEDAPFQQAYHTYKSNEHRGEDDSTKLKYAMGLIAELSKLSSYKGRLSRELHLLLREANDYRLWIYNQEG